MIITAHQPAYLGWLGYFHKIALADKFILLDDVQFEKNSFVNRNRIKTSNGPAWLTIPLDMKGHMDKTISEITIDQKTNWPKKHWNSLLLNYKKAPFFSQYADFFEQYYAMVTTPNLNEFVSLSTNFLLKELTISIPSEKLSNTGVKSKKQELIIDLCKQCEANGFIFGALGKNYADESLFRSNHISIYFQEYKHPVYQQLWGEFVPFLSVLDALFNLGPQRTKELIFENNITSSELKTILGK
jgi:hypothetical protein